MGGIGHSRTKDYMIFALFMTCIFLFQEVVIRAQNFYMTAPLVDIPSHFLAGFAMGSWFFLLFSLKGIKHIRLFTVLFTFLGDGVWEVLEMIDDKITPQPYYLIDPFFWDGFWDIFFTTLGGFIVLFYIDYTFNRKRKSENLISKA